GGRARPAQDGLARNKRRSGFSREAPRGRRSISQAPEISSQAPPNPTLYRPTPFFLYSNIQFKIQPL
ncbi:hypothetical protein ACIP1G_31470, partial [Pseudomonas sp. NPDC089392]|uniref:hypothetical protein n=1 Tax=Pseudomonas sp. NPDC089392 TaxID=3364459 RepID=UPI00380C7155